MNSAIAKYGIQNLLRIQQLGDEIVVYTLDGVFRERRSLITTPGSVIIPFLDVVISINSINCGDVRFSRMTWGELYDFCLDATFGIAASRLEHVQRVADALQLNVKVSRIPFSDIEIVPSLASIRSKSISLVTKDPVGFLTYLTDSKLRTSKN